MNTNHIRYENNGDIIEGNAIRVEEIMFGNTRGPKNIVATLLEDDGRFKTFGYCFDSQVTDTVWDDTREAADNSFIGMMQSYANPLQAAFFRANMQSGKRYTFVTLGDFGFPVALQMTFDLAKCETYAQYNDAVYMQYKLAKKRNMRGFHLRNREFLIYEGWRELTKDISGFIETHSASGLVCKESKYASFDPRFMGEIAAAWPDYLVAYDPRAEQPREAQPAAKEKPIVEEPKPFQPREIVPGIMLIRDDEFQRGLTVDMSPEMFSSLYGEVSENLSAEDRLIRALRRAACASAVHAEDDDGGACNFDAPVLDYKAYGISKAAALNVLEKLGFGGREWTGQLVIRCGLCGQGERRTNMAEAFYNSLKSDGIPADMYYQMD